MQVQILPVVNIASNNLSLAGDKSISHRSIILSSILPSQNNIINVLDSDDINQTIREDKNIS